MLEWLADTAVARMVQESMWGYPIVLSAHAVGMAIFAGIVLVLNFRVLGLAGGMSFEGLRTIYRIAWVGLVINAVSGVMLFAADGARFFASTPFRIKIILLVTAIGLLVAMARQIFAAQPLYRGEAAPAAAKAMAAFSTLALLGVIVAGRLIAYWEGV